LSSAETAAVHSAKALAVAIAPAVIHPADIHAARIEPFAAAATPMRTAAKTMAPRVRLIRAKTGDMSHMLLLRPDKENRQERYNRYVLDLKFTRDRFVSIF
jgi:hypothetical protein